MKDEGRRRGERTADHPESARDVARPLQPHSDMARASLETYLRKRDFGRTPEPRGEMVRRAASAPLRFVVQKHGARRLHYDFRLELDGVLKSWAVPRGPSLVPGARRLAVATEDHPVSYASFEGVIPKGEYGAGPVVVWDRGHWFCDGDPREGIERGRLEFTLEGEKLRGGWRLVRMRGDDGDNWLLMKRRDEAAMAGEPDALVQSMPASVLTGRDLDEVRAGADRTTPPVIERVRDEARVNGVRISHPDRVLFPEQGLTKIALAAYYATIAEVVVPAMYDRPLTLLRCPDGRHEECFHQKQPGPSAPEGLSRVRVKDGTDYLRVRTIEDLLGLVQMGVLEVHVWGSRADRLDRPDILVFDLDPDPAVPWAHVVATAETLRARLHQLDLAAFARVTGGKGLHVVTPIERRTTWEDAKAFTHAVARELVGAAPEHFTTNVSRAARKGKILVDYLRNAREATAIASYSVRAREGAPVAVPIAWEELAGTTAPPRLSTADVIARVDAGVDPWREFDAARARLTKTAMASVKRR